MLNKVDLSRADLNLLVLFNAVYEAAHVGRAADRLNLSPSAVSHGLGRLRRMFNDPLFLKTPKGVVATDRADQLAPVIDDILQRARAILGKSEPFDPATSTRRLVVGAPDGVSAVFLQPLLAKLHASAPNIDLGVRQLLPVAGETLPLRAWSDAFADLEARTVDVAVVPCDEAPLRFSRRVLYEEDFVLAMRSGHPLSEEPTVEQYCRSQHLVVSVSGDPHGFVDDVLAKTGRSRRVGLTVPNFMFACAVLPTTDLVCAMPRRFAERYAERFGFVTRASPLALGAFRLNAFVPEPALMDDGVAWLLDRLAEATA